jgi:hypothetical protein
VDRVSRVEKKLLTLHAKNELALEHVAELLATMRERFRLRFANRERLMHH